MRSFGAAAAAAVAFSALASAAITTPVTVKGNAFFVGNNRVSIYLFSLLTFTNVLMGIVVLHPWC